MINDENKNLNVDIHAHVWSTEYLDMLEEFGATNTSVHRGIGAEPTEQDLQTRFHFMNKAGIDLQVLSAVPQVPYFESIQHATQAAIYINNEYYELVKKHPDKFAAFASLPLPHIDASLKELARAMDELGMRGVAITTSILGKSPVDAEFTPIFEELNRRKGILFIHPAGFGAHSSHIQDYHLTWRIGSPIEDTIIIGQFITEGIPSKYPDLKIIIPHLGGAIPMLLPRMDNLHWEAPLTPEKASVAAKRMWYDTVGHGNIQALRAAAETYGSDQLLFGSDFPYQHGELLLRSVDYVKESLSYKDADPILYKNAAKLLGIQK
ncbi:amidohydrolase family protein [Paenibacillus elgii]|uniref:amidohydrolase family protein n=1 Tax=Paenibacillus elgii TaxID=189691 RepID=UPI00196814B4|nr:amidohydrolase family protein [Paenibacillus elgii]